ncbi:MAG TPA: 23S rRNA (adenine(2030)-N(6))-methyltransferase RlmJ [Steroidobacteraceae bacterium]
MSQIGYITQPEMKYRHSFHAGNFADVHKHVTLLTLLTALKKKDKGFLYLDTHAGRGSYDLSSPSPEAAAGIGRFALAAHTAAELRQYAALLEQLRSRHGQRHMYPGSPLIAANELRSQDRAVLIEVLGAEARALQASLAALAQERRDGPRTVRVERGDGFERLRAWLPPQERRGLTFIDPPYEQTQQDFGHVTAALAEGLRRFPTGVFAAWYPIKDERSTVAWRAACAPALPAQTLLSELWLYPRDSRVGLNGSGVLIANPPYLTLERMAVWLPQLQACLALGPAGGSSVRMLSQSSP